MVWHWRLHGLISSHINIVVHLYYMYVQPDNADSSKMGSHAISQVAIGLRPRYHFCALEGVHYERQPYRLVHTFAILYFGNYS